MTPTPLENHQDIKELREKHERVSIELGGMKNLTEGVRNAMDGLIIELKGLRKDMRENYVSRREFENTEKELDEMRDREMKKKICKKEDCVHYGTYMPNGRRIYYCKKYCCGIKKAIVKCDAVDVP